MAEIAARRASNVVVYKTSALKVDLRLESQTSSNGIRRQGRRAVAMRGRAGGGSRRVRTMLMLARSWRVTRRGGEI